MRPLMAANFERFKSGDPTNLLVMSKGSTRQYAPLLLSFDSAKSALFYYVLLTQAVKLQRHIRARGIVASAKELYTWIAQVLQFTVE